MDLPNQQVSQVSPGEHRFEFRGQAGEYFRIWIVNVLLTVLTLGIYSAWAKVRTHRYFYRNTYLDGTSFDYLASPITILKGRLILAAGLALYFGAGYVAPLLQFGLMLVVLGLMPWILQRALRFRLGNTGYRNLRFHFVGGVGESYGVMARGGLLSILTLGLASPWAIWLRMKYAVDNARYGTSAFNLGARSTPFFVAYYGAGAIVLVGMVVFGLVLSGVVAGARDSAPEQLKLLLPLVGVLFYLPAYLLAWAFAEAKVFNTVLDTLQLDDHRFGGNMTTSGLAWMIFSSGVGVLLSLGLLLPWAKIRVARYRLAHARMLPAGALSDFVADQEAQIGATGDEVGAYLDLDLGI